MNVPGIQLSKLKKSKFPMPKGQPVCLEHNLWLIEPYQLILRPPELLAKYQVKQLVIDIPQMLSDGCSVPEIGEVIVGEAMDPFNLVWAIPHDVGFSSDCTGDAAKLTFDDWNDIAVYMMKVDGYHGVLTRSLIHSTLSRFGRRHFRKAKLMDTCI